MPPAFQAGRAVPLRPEEFGENKTLRTCYVENAYVAQTTTLTLLINQLSMQSQITTLVKLVAPEATSTLISKTPTRFKQLKHMIGNTPLLAIRFAFRGKERVIYAKAEHLNMTGSIKDRMAFHIIKRAYQDNHIQPGDTIAEATSGNTGISFAAIGRALGHQVVIFMPDWMSEERSL